MDHGDDDAPGETPTVSFADFGESATFTYADLANLVQRVQALETLMRHVARPDILEARLKALETAARAQEAWSRNVDGRLELLENDEDDCNA